MTFDSKPKIPEPVEKDPPFTLLALGYKKATITPKGYWMTHPEGNDRRLYPVFIEKGLPDLTQADCVALMVDAAFRQGLLSV